MGPGQNFLTGLGQFFVAQVGMGQPLWFRSEFGKFPLEITNFQFFLFGSKITRFKDSLASYLLRVKSTLG